jgi:anti-anti-sigma factor
MGPSGPSAVAAPLPKDGQEYTHPGVWDVTGRGTVDDVSLSQARRTDAASLAIEVRPDREAPHKVTVVLRGEIDLSTVQAVRSVLQVLDPRQRLVVLDLSGVTFIDSMGIGLLVETRRRFEPEFRELLLRAPSEQVRQVLEITGLLQVFPIVDP